MRGVDSAGEGRELRIGAGRGGADRIGRADDGFGLRVGFGQGKRERSFDICELELCGYDAD